MKTIFKSWVILLLLVNHALASGSFQSITAKEGRLLYADGSEVNLFGVNFQPMLSWEHAARMHNQGILMPLKAKDLKEVADASFDQIQLLGAEIIRIHLHPADFTDAEGNLVETIWLDLLDYTLSQAQSRGLYIYLTLLNHLDHHGTQFPYDRESFAAKYSREDWMSEDEAISATKRYIAQLLNRQNSYNGQMYKAHAALAVLEPINEPAYVRFDKWQLTNKDGTRDQFNLWSYNNTKSYINDMVALLRAEGMTQPVVWNCGWARLITKNRASFRGIAASHIDAVSFCLYPGQADLKAPFWKNTEDLSEQNYLPYIKECSDNQEWLGWLRSDAFKTKAKLVYEYETFCNQSGYLYPAMAAFYHSVGAQIATQWTYGLTSYAEYLGGSHVFNIKTTPRKAASFMVAKQQFKDVATTYSYESRSSAVLHNGCLIYSGWPESDEWSQAVLGSESVAVQSIIGVGNSPFVRYSGSGLYFIQPCENDALRLTIMPDVEFIRPHWKELHTGEMVAKIDDASKHRFDLLLPDFEGANWIYRRDNWRWQLVEKLEGTISFEAQAGEYLIEKQPVHINRKVLEEGWGD